MAAPWRAWEGRVTGLRAGLLVGRSWTKQVVDHQVERGAQGNAYGQRRSDPGPTVSGLKGVS